MRSTYGNRPKVDSKVVDSHKAAKEKQKLQEQLLEAEKQHAGIGGGGGGGGGQRLPSIHRGQMDRLSQSLDRAAGKKGPVRLPSQSCGHKGPRVRKIGRENFRCARCTSVRLVVDFQPCGNPSAFAAAPSTPLLIQEIYLIGLDQMRTSGTLDPSLHGSEAPY